MTVEVEVTAAPAASDEQVLTRLLAYVYLQNGAIRKAQTLYAALLALDPADSEAATGLAWAMLEADQPQAALNVLDTIAGPGQPDAAVHLLRARAFARLDRLDDAGVAMRAFGMLRQSPLPLSDAS